MDIEEQALKIAELRGRETEALRAGKDGTWLDLIFEQFKAIEVLERALMEKSVVVATDPRARKILEELDLTDIEDLDDRGDELLYSWFSTRDYARGLSHVNALISPVQVRRTLRTFVDEARQSGK